MKIDKETIDRLAHLSRLQFSEKETTRMQGDLENMLTFIDKINRLDLDGIAPLVYMTEGEDELREDVVIKTITKDEALKNAPDRDTDYFRVPKVMRRNEE